MAALLRDQVHTFLVNAMVPQPLAVIAQHFPHVSYWRMRYAVVRLLFLGRIGREPVALNLRDNGGGYYPL